MENGLERFLNAHRTHYRTVLQEIRSGKKKRHWISESTGSVFSGRKGSEDGGNIKKTGKCSLKGTALSCFLQ